MGTVCRLKKQENESMIEIDPIVFLENKMLKEHEYAVVKNSDKSVLVSFKSTPHKVRIAPSVLTAGTPAIWIDGIQLDYGSYKVFSYQPFGKAGVDILFEEGPIKRLGFVPRVLMGEEEKIYKQQKAKEAREQYEKEHPEVIRFFQ